jgi:hypothetical protein
MRQKAYYTNEETNYNLYTIGQEWMTEDGTEYKGAYHSYITGEVYTESTYRPGKSVKLVKFETISSELTTYKKLKQVTSKYNEIRSSYPIVTESDKSAKYITRYFIKKINETSITEIDESQYIAWTNKKIDPNLYNAIKLIWFVAGSLTSETINGTLYLSVSELNAQRVVNAERSMPGISQKLNNLLELYSDTEFTAPKDINQ